MEQPKEKIFDTKKILTAVIGAVAGVLLIAVGAVLIMQFTKKTENKTEPDPTVATEPEPEPTIPEKLDLQLPLDQWLTAQTASKNSGVLIYDIDNDAIVARHNEDTKFRIESIYKMFVAYEGYYRIDNKKWDGDATYAIANDFNNKRYTRSLCLDHMIRYSYSPCAEVMWGEIGHDNLQAAYKERGFKDTNIQAITSTPSDLVKLYQMYWKHPDLSEESWKKIQDSMLNQVAPTKNTTYARNWRQGLPSGFNTAVVYNKVGWLGDGNGNWTYYDDAAFVVFPEVEKNKDGEKKLARHYIIVALTNNTKPAQLVKLGQKIEDFVKTSDKY